MHDDRWNSRNFGLQRVKDVTLALRYLEKHETARYNIESVAIAKFATMAAGMMAGRKSKVTPEDFLPFDTRKMKKENGVTDESMRVLMSLMKTRKMNGRVIAMLADEIKNFSSRNQD